MKTKTWMILIAIALVALVLLSLPLLKGEPAQFARVLSGGTEIAVVDLSQDQEFTVAEKNTVTVRDGKIAVTWADCPDHYCMKRGFCDSGAPIVCLPNKLTIEFLGEQTVDGAVG